MPKASDHEQYRSKLTELQFWVTRQGGTEPPGSGMYVAFDEPGTYLCICCEAPLFRSTDKFDGKCGWPNFKEPAPGNPTRHVVDRSYGGIRTEVRCAHCEAHLGHVFDDGPAPTGLRYCINSAALTFQHAP